MNELNEYVRELRNEFPKYYVPDFDPNNGGIHATVLFLFEKPGPKTDPKNKGSGYISQDNDDETARAGGQCSSGEEAQGSEELRISFQFRIIPELQRVLSSHLAVSSEGF